MNRNEIKTDIDQNVYTNTTKRIKGNTIRDRLRNIADFFLNRESDVVSAIDEATADEKIADVGAMKAYVAENGGATPTWQQVTTEGASTDQLIEHNRIENEVVRNVKNVTTGEIVIQEFLDATGNGCLHILDKDGNVKVRIYGDGTIKINDVDVLTGMPTFQQVTTEGYETTEVIRVNVDAAVNAFLQLSRQQIAAQSGGNVTQLNFATPSGSGTIIVPNVGNATKTLATTDQIPAYNDRFKGKYTSLSALNTAVPSASDGDYAIVDAGAGSDAKEYIWDAQAGWVTGTSAGASTTDALPEGSSNLYFTNARALAAAPAETASTVGALITAATSPSISGSHLIGGAASGSLIQFSVNALKTFLQTAFDSVYTTTSAVATQITAALVGYATQSWVTAQGYITSIPLNIRSVLAETATDGAVSSGTANTYSAGVLITPSMIDADTSIEVLTRVRKSGTNGTLSIRLYANTTNDLSGTPVLLTAVLNITASNVYSQISRTLAIKVKNGTGAGTELYNTSISGSLDTAVATSAVTTCAIDWTVNQYIIVSVQTANGGDAARSSFLKVRR